MKAQDTKSNSTMPISPTKRLVRDKFALLAKVGRLKREVSQLREEVKFYSSSATELAAVSVEQLGVLQPLAEAVGEAELKMEVAVITSRHLLWMRKLLKHWPSDSECQQKLLALLESEGPQRLMASTPDGYATLSTGLILNNVAQIIEATRELPRRASSHSTTRTQSASAGTASVDQVPF